MARRYGCQVVALDPTPRAIRYAEQALATSGVTFLAYGLWSDDCEQRFYEPRHPEHASFSIGDLQGTGRYVLAACRSLESLMGELGHDRINLLKLDVEGAEYRVLESLLDNRIRVDVLCVELHASPTFEAVPRCLRHLEDIGYSVVHLVDTTATLVDARHLAAAQRGDR